MDIFFIYIHISEKYLQFRKKSKTFVKENFWFTPESFSNYVYLKVMHITLKGIGKSTFVSVLKILLICKFLNFMPSSLKKKQLSKVYLKFLE